MHYREKSNLLLGIIGAVLGDVLGIAMYLGMHRYYVRGVLGGTAICLLVFLGYQLFGGRMDAKGLVICSLLCIISIYPTELAAVTLDIVDEMKKQNKNKRTGTIPKEIIYYKKHIQNQSPCGKYCSRVSCLPQGFFCLHFYLTEKCKKFHGKKTDLFFKL